MLFTTIMVSQVASILSFSSSSFQEWKFNFVYLSISFDVLLALNGKISSTIYLSRVWKGNKSKAKGFTWKRQGLQMNEITASIVIKIKMSEELFV